MPEHKCLRQMLEFIIFSDLDGVMFKLAFAWTPRFFFFFFFVKLVLGSAGRETFGSDIFSGLLMFNF